ncbi:MAG: 4-hydroxy-3-methylbut-2-enyl diphosphate reductase [Thermoguttaceae bacterium]|jgi:4-hydroxy-3-methylbut-2-enyl diphosphate reductase|nr:4-hydroxy-3-methylbut-2-enyl diphosphate reductase [Thermoguttaceae bacterium]
MHIILVAPRGFCAGVNMAIESLEQALERYGSPVYVYHEIVHNRWVVERFRQRGVVFVDGLGEVPAGATLLFSAHGVAPEVRRCAKERKLRVIDATCPLVTKVHREAIRLAGDGYTIVLIGHAGHDEVEGTLGEAPESIVLVQNVEDVERVEPADSLRVAYLTQTTLSVTDAQAIIGRLKQRFPAIIGPAKDDICYATQNRQTAVRDFAPGADLVLVVGSRNSSNSRRLAEMGSATGVPSHLIDGPEDIDVDWFETVRTVLMTAGASAPEDVVQQCVAWLAERFDATVEERSICEEQVRFSLPQVGES